MEQGTVRCSMRQVCGRGKLQEGTDAVRSSSLAPQHPYCVMSDVIFIQQFLQAKQI